MTPSTPETLAKLNTRAQAVIDALQQRNYKIAVTNFDSTMTSIMPWGKLEEEWTNLVNTNGAFVDKVAMRADSLNGAPAVIVTCKFEKGSADMLLVFDAADKISDLSFVPTVIPVVEAQGPITGTVSAPRTSHASMPAMPAKSN